MSNRNLENKWYNASEIKDHIVKFNGDPNSTEAFMFNLDDLRTLVQKLDEYNQSVVQELPEQECTSVRFWITESQLNGTETQNTTPGNTIVAKNLIALPANADGDDLHALDNAEINKHKVSTNANGNLNTNGFEAVNHKDIILSKAKPCPNHCGTIPPKKLLRDQ